jgi:hypothetical protein
MMVNTELRVFITSIFMYWGDVKWSGLLDNLATAFSKILNCDRRSVLYLDTVVPSHDMKILQL